MEERRRDSDRQFDVLSKKIDEHAEKLTHKVTTILVEQATVKEKIINILAQTTATNGRVNDLEEDLDNLDMDHRKLHEAHERIVNRAIGWSAGAGLIIALLFKLFWN
jgi:superfamily I DNA and RNA helicase